MDALGGYASILYHQLTWRLEGETKASMFSTQKYSNLLTGNSAR